MARPEFLHLHNHTTYSSRDALQQLPEMCAAAAADRQRAIAITDHGNLAGTWKFAREAAQAGLKPILGEEMYLAHGSRFERDTEASAGDDEISSGGGEGGKRSSYHHLTVLAANPMGWRNLVLLDTLANDAEAYWRKPRVDIDLLAEHNQGLVVLTGCIGGPVAGPLAAGDPDRAQRNLRALVDIFGTDRLRVEVMSHDILGFPR